MSRNSVLPARAAPFAAFLLVTTSGLWAYRHVLWTGTEEFPWGSDTWSHLFKAEYLFREIGQGNWYPNLLPDWYMGLEMLRYHAPLTYYLLAGIYSLTGDMFRAGNLLLFSSAWLGAISILLFRRTFGWVPVTLAGVLYTWLPDNLRVAFSEGNLPRALASAFLPLSIFFLWEIVHQKSPDTSATRVRAFVGLSIALALIVLSHAMMGAIFAACLGGIALIAVLIGATSVRLFWTALASIVAGLALSAWWLLPSLAGGITEIDPNALSEALARFSPTFSLNPMIRLKDPEAFYLGLALCVAAVVSLCHWPRLSNLSRLLLVVGVLTVAVTFDGVYDLFAALPLHQELWPIRFTSFSGPALLLGVAASLPMWRWRPLAVFAALAIALDLHPSAALAHTNPPPTDLIQVAETVRGLQGWRVAVADSSRLGSKPSYLLSEVAGREQVYGWAYQGARTARVVAALNESMEQGFTGYAVDRLNIMGADDVLIAPTMAFAPELGRALEESGWVKEMQFESGKLYHRPGAPRATQLANAVLGIGPGAYEAALIFPSIMAAPSAYVDDYQLADLAPYPVVYLSHFTWHSMARAEELLLEYVRAGGHVVVDLSGTPPDGLARVPKFLGVYGEPVILRGAVSLSDAQGLHQLSEFGSPNEPWHAFVPQGNLDPLSTFDYMGQLAVGTGERKEGAGHITFLGLNLTYHSLLTHDLESIRILESELGYKSEGSPVRINVPLAGYHADVNGYGFSYDLDRDSWLLLPIAHLDGLRATLDGRPLTTMALDTLVAFRAPAGRHEVKAIMGTTPIHSAGAAISLIAVLSLFYVWLRQGWRASSARRLARLAKQPATVVAASLLLFLSLSASAYAANIVVDGNFDDWNGQACITDPSAGDAADPEADISALCWANNPGDSTMYWMIQRMPPQTSKPISYLLHVDTNNDGTYEQTVTIAYQATPSKADVTVDHGGTGAGETRSAGGRRVEIGVPFSGLGITAGTVIRFYLESQVGGAVVDSTESVQVSAVPIVETPLLIILAGCGVVGLWWVARKRRWTS